METKQKKKRKFKFLKNHQFKYDNIIKWCLTIHFLNHVAFGSTRARKCSGVMYCRSEEPNPATELEEKRLNVLSRTDSRNLKKNKDQHGTISYWKYCRKQCNQYFLKKRISDCLLEKRQFLFVRLFNYLFISLFSKRCLLNFYNTELQLKQQYSYGKNWKVKVTPSY